MGNIVYFRKVENELSSKWTVGKVSDVVKSKDGVVRRCTVQYQISMEVGVQHHVRAKVMKMKMAKGCKNCCCAHHCQVMKDVMLVSIIL